MCFTQVKFCNDCYPHWKGKCQNGSVEKPSSAFLRDWIGVVMPKYHLDTFVRLHAPTGVDTINEWFDLEQGAVVNDDEPPIVDTTLPLLKVKQEQGDEICMFANLLNFFHCFGDLHAYNALSKFKNDAGMFQRIHPGKSLFKSMKSFLVCHGCMVRNLEKNHCCTEQRCNFP